MFGMPTAKMYKIIVDERKCPNCESKLDYGLDAGDNREVMACGTCATCWTVDHGSKTVTRG
ncbi:hypothetical protein SM033_00188 [Vibrio phage vB_VpaM_sm033]|nr:hypothetical protein SM033_00188 [Vibrio phage vB_VpaM_sm033]